MNKRAFLTGTKISNRLCLYYDASHAGQCFVWDCGCPNRSLDIDYVACKTLAL